MSKSNIKTNTVLTIADMKESTELPAFKRQKDGKKVTRPKAKRREANKVIRH